MYRVLSSGDSSACCLRLLRKGSGPGYFYFQDAGRVKVPPAPSGKVFGNCDLERSIVGKVRST